MASPAPKAVADQRTGTWLFGSLLLVFYLAVFLFGPSVLPSYKYQMLGIISALLAGLFAYFLTGNIVTSAKGTISGASMGVRATGGAGLAIAMLLWWTYGPLQIQTPEQAAVLLQQQLQQAADSAGTTSPAPVQSSGQASAHPSAAPMERRSAPQPTVRLSPSIQKLAKDLAASDPKYAAVGALQNKNTIPVEQLAKLRNTLAANQVAK
ncbi:MAG TPA: hypothetical protein VLW65_12270 [Bryobacteraceae bacterium]|nr:hypothetical protein [Bryobacteraceae bacterium]